MNTFFRLGASPWFHVKMDDEVPGFRVARQDVVPGLKVGTNDLARGEANWPTVTDLESTPQNLPTSQMILSPFSKSRTFDQSNPSVPPDWLNKLLTMPLPQALTVLHPPTGRRIAPYSPLINETLFNPTEDADEPEAQDADVDKIALPSGSEAIGPMPSVEWPPSYPAAVTNAPVGAASPQAADNPSAAPRTIGSPWPPISTDRANYFRSGPGEFEQPSLPEPASYATLTTPMQWDTAAATPNPARSTTESAWRGRGPLRFQPPERNMLSIMPERRLAGLPPTAPMLQASGLAMGDLEPRRERAAQPVHLHPPPGEAQALPSGSVISSDSPYGPNSPATRLGPPATAWPSDEGIADSTGGRARWELNVHRVGDGDTPSDLSRYERHQLGVEHSIAIHLGRGFELVTDKQVAVDVPGFPYPRFYDYIIRDPITRLCYGVEVKTTLRDTVRLDRSQVEKDAVVATLGATVRGMDVKLRGVSYLTYCFGCEALDLRSARLRETLESAGVPIKRGSMPGDIRH